MSKQKRCKSLREAIHGVLADAGEPVPAKELVTRALELHPLPGKTPRATAAAQLAALVKAGTRSGPFTRSRRPSSSSSVGSLPDSLESVRERLRAELREAFERATAVEQPADAEDESDFQPTLGYAQGVVASACRPRSTLSRARSAGDNASPTSTCRAASIAELRSRRGLNLAKNQLELTNFLTIWPRAQAEGGVAEPKTGPTTSHVEAVRRAAMRVACRVVWAGLVCASGLWCEVGAVVSGPFRLSRGLDGRT